MPLIVLSFQPIALILRQTRAAVIEVMTEDYVRTARAKGVPEDVVALRHILRPVLTPVVTQLGLIMITIVNGAIFVELVFGLPGLGRLTVQALINNDYPGDPGGHADRVVPCHGVEPAGGPALPAARPPRCRCEGVEPWR